MTYEKIKYREELCYIIYKQLDFTSGLHPPRLYCMYVEFVNNFYRKFKIWIEKSINTYRN